MPTPALLKRDWQKDHVYLIQFPRAGCIPTISSFALKLETWLRMANIPYTNISNEFTKYSSKKQIPFIELNGRHIPDSNFCIVHLTETFKVDFDNHLDEHQKADARAYNYLVEESLHWIVVYNRAKNNKFMATDKGFIRHFSGAKKAAFQFIILEQFRKKIWKSCYQQGIGRYSISETEEIAKKDLSALSTRLGGQKFFFGDSPCSLDASAFGTLAQLYYTPLCSDVLPKFMDEKTLNLVEFIKRMREMYWKDWDEACRTLSLGTRNTNN